MPHELSWQAFQTFFLEPGKPKAIRLKGKVAATLFVSELGRSMGLRLPAANGVAALRSPMRQLSIEVRGNGKTATLELSTGARALYKEFFLFALDVADAVQQTDVKVAEAVENALRSWRELLQRAARLSTEAELGLIGELLTLQRLAGSRGDTAVDAWIGPLGQRHDFRLDAIELEVKTTSMPSREHYINGWEQMLPSEGTSLYLVSIQLENAGTGKGFSLPSLVSEVSATLGPSAVTGFRRRLGTCGYLDADAAQYTDRFKRRSPDRLIRVDGSFPRMVPDLVDLPEGLMHRIKELHYRIDVAGLGVPDAGRRFASLLQIRSSR